MAAEKSVVYASQWLESNPVGSYPDKRKEISRFVIMYALNTSTVTVTSYGPIINLFDKNSDLNTVWIAGYCSYVISHSYSKDELQANLAGLKSVIKCYNLGGDFKKDKDLAKMLDADKEGKLEDWVKEAIKEKSR
jgi:hypothetical protein